MTPTIKTGAAWMGQHDHLFMGHRIFEELLGVESLTGLIGLALGAPRLTKEDAALIDALGVANALGDPRIWPVKVSRLAASYGSAMHGLCAANLIHLNPMIGAGAGKRGAELLQELMQYIGGAEHLDDEKKISEGIDDLIKRERVWPGFGVAFRQEDERFVSFTKYIEQTTASERPYWRLCLKVGARLYQTKKIHANILSAVCAVTLDLGMTPDQCWLLLGILLHCNFIASAQEEARLCSPSLQGLPLEFISYEGPAPRTSPRETRLQDTLNLPNANNG